MVQGNDGRAKVEFRLWDVYGQKQLIGMSYTTTQDNWRRIGHIISDEIYKHLTGEDGYFDSRIVYIAESVLPFTAMLNAILLPLGEKRGANVMPGNWPSNWRAPVARS